MEALGCLAGKSALMTNAINLLEELRADRRPYFGSRPFEDLVSAAVWQATWRTLTALCGIVQAAHRWPTPLEITVKTVAQSPFADDGKIDDKPIAQSIEDFARQVMEFQR